jgi:hypothetical protein
MIYLAGKPRPVGGELQIISCISPFFYNLILGFTDLPFQNPLQNFERI